MENNKKRLWFIYKTININIITKLEKISNSNFGNKQTNKQIQLDIRSNEHRTHFRIYLIIIIFHPENSCDSIKVTITIRCGFVFCICLCHSNLRVLNPNDAEPSGRNQQTNRRNICMYMNISRK